MNQKTNKKTKKSNMSTEEMRRAVLKSGLCDEFIAGVLPDKKETPKNAEVESKTAEKTAPVEKEEAGNKEKSPLSKDEFDNCISQFRESSKTTKGVSVDGLLCRIYDLVNQKNQLLEVIEKLQKEGEANATKLEEKPQSKPQKASETESETKTEEIPKSMGSTRETLKKKSFIPKSQVEKMSREEIRELFDLIDKSRKEW